MDISPRQVSVGVMIAIAALLGTTSAGASPGGSAGTAPKAGTTHHFPKAAGMALDASCPRGIAVGSSTCGVSAEPNDGSSQLVQIRHGKVQSPVAVNPGGTNIVCPAKNTCVFVATQQKGSKYVGALQWVVDGTVGKLVRISGGIPEPQVACPSPTMCVAVGDKTEGHYGHAMIAFIAQGATSVTAKSVPGVAHFQAVSCQSAKKCIATGLTGDGGSGHGVFVPIAGHKVGSVHKVAGTTELNDISCGSTTTCVAAAENIANSGDAGLVVVIHKGKAGKPHKGQFVTRISCGSATLCVEYSIQFTSTGKPYTLVSRIKDGTLKGSAKLFKWALPRITCPTAAKCLVVQGTAWMTLTP